MGNQVSQSTRKISNESASGEASVDSTPKKTAVGRFEIVTDQTLLSMTKSDRQRQGRRHSDVDKHDIDKCFPSPQMNHHQPLSKFNSAGPTTPKSRVSANKSNDVSTPSTPAIQKTPKIGFKRFQVDFNLNFKSRKDRRRRISGEQEPLSFKIQQAELPQIPHDEIFRALHSDIEKFNYEELPSLISTNFRSRATTISNGHVARLKSLVESETNGTEPPNDHEVAKKARPGRRKKIPTVFRYHTTNAHDRDEVDHSKPETVVKEPKKVFIAGTMTGWKCVEMVRTKGDAYFCVVIDCYEGDIYYKFCVDGEWTIDYKSEKAIGKENVLANVLTVKKSDSEALEALAFDSFIVKSKKTPHPQTQGEWGQEKPKWSSKSRTAGTDSSSSADTPPFLPPQLLKSLLNKEIEDKVDPNLLPEPPSHVMLNHLYAQSVKDNVLVMACTTRFRKKYTTMVLYKPIN